MPIIITDTIPHNEGNKDNSNRGSYVFGDAGIAVKNWTETYLILTEPPVIIPPDPGPPAVPAYSVLIVEEDVLNTPGLPILGQLKREAWCIGLNAKCLSDKAKSDNIIDNVNVNSPYYMMKYDGLWEVTAHFNADVSTRIKNSTEYRDDGLLWPVRLDFIPAILDWTTETYNEAILEDAQVFDEEKGSMKTIENTAGEPLYPESQRTRPVLNVDFFVRESAFPHLDFDIAEKYTNKLNKDQFFGAPPGCVRCSSLKYTRTDHVPYYDGLNGYDTRGILDDDNADQDDKDQLTAAIPPMTPAKFLHIKATFKFLFWYEFACITPPDDPENPYNALAIDPDKQGWMLRLLNYGNYMKVPKEADDPDNTDSITEHASEYDKSPVRVNLSLDGYKLDPTSPKVFLPFNQYPLADFDEILPIWLRPVEPLPLDPITPGPCPDPIPPA